VLWTRVEHLRYAADLAHALISFGPGREDSIGLGPMGDRGLIAPMQKTWHGSLVRPGRLLYLPEGAEGIKRKEGKKAKGSESQAG
jgi:hypothetical protein